MKFFRLIVCALLCLPSAADAFFHGSASGVTVTPTAGIVGFDGNMFPFVNLLKMAGGGPSKSNTTYIFPNNLTANQYPTGTLGGSNGYGFAIPTNYFGKYVLSVTGTVSGSGVQGLGFGNNFYGQVYSTTGTPTIVGCTSPCAITNNLIARGSNFTITFDFSATVTGAVDNGSGIIRLSVVNSDLANGQTITVNGVVGSDGNGCGANGQWTVAGRTGTTIDLTGSTFPGGCTYTSGGQIFPYQQTGNFSPQLSIGSGTTLSGITNISVCKLADYNADNTCGTTAGKTTWASGFNDDFVQSVAALKPKYIRFLDVNNAVFHQAAAYADGPTTSWFSYNIVDGNFIQSKWFGSSTGTNSYAITCTAPCTYALTGGAPVDGDLVQFYMPNANTNATPTLTVTDVNSVTSSAIPIRTNDGFPVHVAIGGTITAGDVVTLTFTSSCIAGGSSTAPYTVLAGDTAAKIGAGLTAAISGNSALTSPQLLAIPQNALNNGQIGVAYASNACALTVTSSVSGAATETATVGTANIGTLTINTLHTFVYNALLASWVANDTFPGGVSAQWPFQTMVDLANSVSTASHVSVGCWMQTNLLWSNASYTALSNFLAANSCSGGTWLEISNEIWNGGNPETTQAANIGASLGFGYDAVDYYMLRSRQLFAIAQTSFAGQLGNLNTIAEFQLSNVSTSFLNGTKLCGTACSNNAYQNAIGVDYNVGAGQPHNFFTALSEAPYYNGSIVTSGGYGASNTYGTWSATSSSVSSNVLTVSGTVTGTIYPNQGISSCDGAYIANPTPSNWASGQLSGTVTTTLNGALSRNNGTATLTSTAGLSVNMWVYDQTTGFIEGIITAINGGASQITIGKATGAGNLTIFPSKGANDTMVFGGLAGTYQLNSTSCSAASGTITGGDVLGLRYAADNYNGVGGGLGNQQDALNWLYQDALASVKFGEMAPNSSVQSEIDSFNIINNIGGYGLPVQDYEGGFQDNPPSTSQATTMGLPSAAYGGNTGFVGVMITAFKNSSLMFNLETTRHSLELANLSARSTTAWYVFSSNGQWALFPTNLYGTPYQSYNAIQTYN